MAGAVYGERSERPDWWYVARHLRAEGYTPGEIAEKLGKNPQLISNITAGFSPNSRARQRQKPIARDALVVIDGVVEFKNTNEV